MSDKNIMIVNVVANVEIKKTLLLKTKVIIK